jgi:hypothetical protein
MGGSGRRRKKDPTEDVGSQLLLSFGLLEGLLPIGGGKLQEAVPGPAGDEAQQVAKVGERLDPVEPGAGKQGSSCFRCTKCRLGRPQIVLADVPSR